MAISSIGAGSGVLTSDVIDQLVEVERAPTEKRLTAEEEVVNAEISEFGTLKGLVSDFEASVAALNLSSSFKNNTATSSSESAVTGSASSVALPGLYSIEVDELAMSQTIASLEFSELTDIVGEGTFTFTFGKVETTRDANNNITSFDNFTADAEQAVKTLKIDATNHTVAGVRDAINNANLGIRATVVDTGSGYRLLLQSEKTGEDNGFTVEVSNPTNGLDQFNFNATSVGAGLLHTTEASDAEFTVNGLNITREDNLVAGVIAGVTLNLKQTTSGPVTLSVAKDTDAVADKVKSFVDAYNGLKTKINELTKFDVEENQGSLFTGDATVRTMQTQMQAVLGGVITSLNGGKFRALSEIGIATNKDTGLLSFNTTKFKEVASTDVDGLTTLFAKTGTATDSRINFVSGSGDTQAGDYDVKITRLATRGFFEGHATSGSFVIDGLNDTFKINVNGSNSAEIQLAQGSYTGVQLAEHLQAQINADKELQDDGRAVDVVFDATKQSFIITSSTYGSLSSVNFTSLDTDSAKTLGFHLQGQGPRLVGTTESLQTVDTLASALTIDDTNDDFSLTVAGITSGSIELANASYTDGSDLAAALQAAINADSNFTAAGILATVTFSGDQDNGRLDIVFNNDETYAVESADAGLAAALGITTGQQVTDDINGLAVTDDFLTAVTIDTSNDEFTLEVNGTLSNSIQIANASYTDGASLAAAIETAIKADTNLQGVEVEAATAAALSSGSLDIAAAGLDFNAANRGFVLDLNGTRLEVVVNQDATTDLNTDSNVGDVNDNLFAIQSALDTALTGAGLNAGDVLASVSGTGLRLSTAATGASQTLSLLADGNGPQTGVGATVIAGGEDFSALADATFTLDVDGTAVSVDLAATVDGSGVTANDVLTQIQAALDTGLTTAGKAAGEVEARLNGSGQVYFYDTSNQGASADLSVTAIGSDDALGLAGILATNYTGIDGFGVSAQSASGVDAVTLADQASVTYEGGIDKGGFKISFGNSATFTVETAEGPMKDNLGIAESDGKEGALVKGLDVAGTINGVAALGSGRVLTGATGNAAAGFRIEIEGGPLGKRGTASFVRGIADQMDRLLDNLLSNAIKNKETSLSAELTKITEEKQSLTDRIEVFRARLERQFTYNDILVKQLNSTQDYLKTQFEVLNATLTRKN